MKTFSAEFYLTFRLERKKTSLSAQKIPGFIPACRIQMRILFPLATNRYSRLSQTSYHQ